LPPLPINLHIDHCYRCCRIAHGENIL
jgi:hypothetical protein